MMKKVFLLFTLFFSLISTASATMTMQWPESAYFLFSAGQTTSFDEAIEDYPDPIEHFDISLEPWNEPAWCTNYIDMGEISLDSMGDDPPTSGYSYETVSYYTCDYVLENHAYWIKTVDGNYAKIKIVEAVHIGSDPEYGNINRIKFNWYYYGSSEGTSGGSKSADDEVCTLPTSLVLLAMLSSALKH